MNIKKNLSFLLGIFLAITACTTANVVNNQTPGASVTGEVNPSTGASIKPSGSPSTGTSAKPSDNPSTGGTTTIPSLPAIPGGISETEPNDEFTGAMKVSPNVIASVNGTIGDTDKADFYEIEIPAGSPDGLLKASVNETNSSWVPVLLFYNSEKNDLGNSTAENPVNPFVWENPVSSGKKYFLKIEGETEIKTSYGLTLQFTGVPDQFEPNNSFTDAKTLLTGTAVDVFMFAGPDSGDANGNNDVDYFKLDVPEGTKIINVNIENKSDSKAPQNFAVELFDSEQTSFGNRLGDYEQSNFRNEYEIETSGVFYIKVSAANSTIPSKLTVTLE